MPPAPSRKAKPHKRWPHHVALPDVPRSKEPSWFYERQAVRTYPSKELCLQMAKYHHDVTKHEKLMWTWLVTWAFHEMFIEGWVS